jgi:hypothetical protein
MESGNKPPQPAIIIITFIVIQLCYGIYSMAKTKNKTTAGGLRAALEIKAAPGGEDPRLHV